MNEQKKITYQDVFRQKEYMKLFIANIISRFGDSIDSIAFSWLVYEITGQASWSAVIFALNAIPSIVLQPFTGAIVEGWDKKKVMVIADAIRGMVILGLSILYTYHLVTPWLLVLFTLMISSVEAFRMPAASALIPKIIDMEYYTHGASLNSAVSTVMQLFGLGAAGVIIADFGIETAIAIDGVSFFASALLISLIRTENEVVMQQIVSVKNYFIVLVDGWKYLKKEPVIINFIVIGVFANAFLVPLNALQTPLVTEVLGQGTEMLSFLSISMTVCMLVGTIIYPKISGLFSGRIQVVAGGVIIGIAMLLYPIAGQFQKEVSIIYGICLFSSLFLGVGATVVSSYLNIQFVKTVEEEYMARASAIFNASVTAASPIVSLVLGALTTHFSVSIMFVTCGIFCVILFGIVGIRKVAI